MVWLAIVVGAFLFYWFVERRHKIVVLKVAGVIAVFCGLLIAGNLAYDGWKERERREGVTVEFSLRNVERSAQLDKALDMSFRDVHPILQSLFPEIPVTSYPAVKAEIYAAYYLLNTLPPPTDHEVAAVNWSLGKSSATEKALLDTEMRIIRSALKDLSLPRQESMTAIERFKQDSELADKQESLQLEASKQAFKSSISNPQKQRISNLLELRKQAYDRLYTRFNGMPSFQTKLSFFICNKKGVPLNKVSFRVLGYERERSTAKGLDKSQSYDPGYTNLDSDIIIPPSTCTNIEWTGAYRFLHRYEVSEVLGNWGH